MIELSEHDYLVIGFALEDMINRKLSTPDNFPLGEEEPVIKRNIELFRKIDNHSKDLHYENRSKYDD